MGDILRRQEQDKEDESSNKNDNNNNYATDDSTTNANNADIKDNTTESNPCHISPVSHSSTENGMVGTRTESIEDGTPVRRTNPPPTNNSAHSYDSKDSHPSYRNSGVVSKGESTQELLDSSKVHSTAQIVAPTSSTFPSQVVISHFPTVLHHVLVDKDFDGKVVQWLPDGEAWKVIRWDAMRRQVLPKYFADLRDENGSSCGTIDAFLYHLDAWGFNEIQNGTNAGAYRHDLFIRGAQKLCVKMRFSSDLTDGDKLPKTVSPSRSRGGETERSMLQVPMLASVGTDSKMQAQPPNKRPRYDEQAPPMHWPYSTNNSSVIWGGQHPQDASHVHAYGMRGITTAPMNNPYPTNGTYNIDPRTQHCRGPPTSENMPRQIPSQQQYNPPQVRSGRGALRLATSAKNRASVVSSPSATSTFRNRFPVSNRGKGSRKPAACRTTIVAPSSVVTASNASDSKQEIKQAVRKSSRQRTSIALDEAQRIGNVVNGVALAVSHNTKRKLPLLKKEIVVGVPSDMSETICSKVTNAVDDSKKTLDDSS